jgi:hypothetical protein
MFSFSVSFMLKMLGKYEFLFLRGLAVLCHVLGFADVGTQMFLIAIVWLA